MVLQADRAFPDGLKASGMRNIGTESHATGRPGAPGGDISIGILVAFK